VDIAAFYNHYRDLLSEEITGPETVVTTPQQTYLLLPAQFRNGLLGETTGIEIAPEWKPTSFWRLRGSYSFLHMGLEKTAASQDIGTAPIIDGSSPKHQLMVLSGFDLPKKTTLDLDYRYVSALPGQTVSAPPEVVRSYSTANVTFSWTVNSHLKLSAAGLNLFQPFHAEYAGDPGPLVQIRRSGYGQIAWTY
jgi:iron complex outermembrane receptor protein